MEKFRVGHRGSFRAAKVVVLGLVLACTQLPLLALQTPAFAVCGTEDVCSTVAASPLTVAADGVTTSTITVTLQNTGGFISGSTVTLDQGTGHSTISAASGPSSASGVVTFTVFDSTPESVTYTATDFTNASLVIAQTAAVVFYGPTVDGNSTATASPTSVRADGSTTSTVTVTLKDTNSNPVLGHVVTLTAGAGSSTISAASGLSNASGVVTFTVKDSVAESVTYTATDTTNAVPLSMTPTVVFFGPAGAGTSTVVAVPTSVVDDGVTTSTVTVTLLDANSKPVIGATVTLTPNGGTSSTVSAASGPSNASGVVTFTVKDAKAEAVTYTAADTTDSVTITQTATVTFQGGTPTAAQSTVTASPLSVPADGSTTSTITVTLKDSAGNPVSGSTVTLGQGGGASTISAASGPSDLNGVVTFTVKDSTPQTVTYTATDTTDSVIVSQTANVIFTGTPTAAQSTVSASPTSVLDNGVATSTVTVTLKDLNSNPVAGKTVTLGQAGGSSTISSASGPSNASGVVTFTVKDATAEAVTYTATDTTDSVTVTQTATVTYQGGTPTAAQSTVSASPTSVLDNGVATSTVTVTLLDSAGNPVSGKTVTLGQAGGSSTIGAASGTSNLNGVVTFIVKDAKAEAVVYTANDITDSVFVTQTATVTFQGGTVTAAQSTVSASPTSVLDNNTATSTITVTLLDSAGNPVSGKTVTLGQAGGNSTISAASGTSDLNGVVTFTVKDTKAEIVHYTATDTSDSVTVTQTALVFYQGGAVTAAQSTVSASPTSVLDNGVATSTVTVTLLDSAGNPVSGKIVNLGQAGGSSTISAASGTSDLNGVVTFTVKDAKAEVVTYTATDTTDSVTVTQTAAVTLSLIHI